jgi:phage tail protein X
MGEDPSTLRREVEDARVRLGDTVDALAYKVSAPRRLAERTSALVRKRPAAIAAAAGGVLLSLAALSRRRRWG